MWLSLDLYRGLVDFEPSEIAFVEVANFLLVVCGKHHFLLLLRLQALLDQREV